MMANVYFVCLSLCAYSPNIGNWINMNAKVVLIVFVYTIFLACQNCTEWLLISVFDIPLHKPLKVTGQNTVLVLSKNAHVKSTGYPPNCFVLQPIEGHCISAKKQNEMSHLCRHFGTVCC